MAKTADPVPTASTIALDVSELDSSDGPITLDRTSVVDAFLEPDKARPPAERYRLDKDIATGGMGRVVLAHDKDLGRPVAVKVMRRSSPRARRRFIDEVQLAGQLQHPNIVPVHDMGISDGGAGWYTMRYVEGYTLAELIARLAAGDPMMHARFSPARRMKLFLDVLDAVAYAHARGVIHRDLKPANILVGQYGEVFVTDWGIAKRLAAAPDEDEVGVLGTPHYMAPEQARGDHAHVDARADVYALAAILFELLSLHHYLHPLPRDSTKEQVLAAVIERAPMIATGAKHEAQPMRVAMDIARVLDHGLIKDPEKRFQSVADLRAALLAIEDGKPTVECPSTAVLWGLGALRRVMSRAPITGWFVGAGFFGLAAFGAFALIERILR